MDKKNNESQFFWIEIQNEHNPNIPIGTYKRHPTKSWDNVFLDTLKSTPSKIKNKIKHKILCGDFNYNFLKHEYINPAMNF